MRRIFVLALTALALLGVVTPDAFAQAPTPTFKINGLIDTVTTYSRNASNYGQDGDFARNDTQWYARSRGRFDVIGEVGKAKAVLGLEIDLAFGQTGSGDNNIQTAGAQVCFGCTGSYDLNTDVRTVLELKWLYTEFEVPLIPVPTVMRVGAQPFGSAATYKVGTYATGDFAGLNIVSTITPNVKINVTPYVAVEEQLVGQNGCAGSACNVYPFGIAPNQVRGDDWAFIIAPEITPFKGLDLKPMFSYFGANGETSGSARLGRGGVGQGGTITVGNTALTVGSAFRNPNTGNGDGINENRYTLGLDARLRLGAFSLDPSIYYQFGNRRVVVPTQLASPSGLGAGSIAKADISAGMVDIRAGYQIGPLLLEGLFMFASGNKARDTTLKNVNYYQVLSADTGYLADWGNQLSSLGIDYFSAMNEAQLSAGYPGNTIGWDKYGRYQMSLKASYFLTPSLSASAGVSAHMTHRAIDTDAITQNNGFAVVPISTCPGLGTPIPGTSNQLLTVPGGGLLPNYCQGKQDGDTNYMGTEFFATVTWRFAPGLSWDNGFGYFIAGQGLDAFTGSTNAGRSAKDISILTSRVRFTF